MDGTHSPRRSIMNTICHKYASSYGFATLVLVCIACLLPACGYMHSVYVRGAVTDTSGQALPGVVVRVANSDFGALTNALGNYSLGAATGQLQLEFMKTGYTPARLEVTVDAPGVVEAAPVALWPLPMVEGVFLFKNYRYYQTTHPRPNQYNVKGHGVAFGTPVAPELIIPWKDSETHPEANPPVFVGHRMPAYDARLHKLHRTEAALIHDTRESEHNPDNTTELQYHEEVLIAEHPIPLRSRILDEMERLLVELRPLRPLEPGVYAIHWGALEGYDSIEPRIFLFEMEAPETDPEAEDEDEDEAVDDEAVAENAS